MENPGDPRETQKAQEIPIVSRGIINYFLIAENLPPEAFQPTNINNPIRFILQNKEVSERDRRYFLEKLANHDYGHTQILFFRDLVGPQSPVSLNEKEKQTNLNIIRNDPDLTEILDLYPGGVKDISVNPNSIDITWGVYSTRKRIQGANPEKALEEFQKFLTLVHGEKAFEFAKNFTLLKADAIKQFGETPKRWERPPRSTGWSTAGDREQSDSTGFGNRPHNWTRPSYGWAPPPPRSESKSGQQSSWDEAANRFKEEWGNRNPPPPPPKQEAKKPPTLENVDPKGYYRVLGLDPTEMRTLSPEEYAHKLKKAYRTAALANHTDVGGSREAIVAVNLAHDFLSDPLKRQGYGR